MKCLRFLWHQPPGHPPHSRPAKGRHPQMGPEGSRKTWNVARKPSVERDDPAGNWGSGAHTRSSELLQPEASCP